MTGLIYWVVQSNQPNKFQPWNQQCGKYLRFSVSHLLFGYFYITSSNFCHPSCAAGWVPVPELLEAFRTEFALRLLWGQSGAAGDRRERYEKFDKILNVLSDKLEPIELTAAQADPLTWASGTVLPSKRSHEHFLHGRKCWMLACCSSQSRDPTLYIFLCLKKNLASVYIFNCALILS